MIAGDDFIGAAREIAGQDATITLLRISLFGLGALAALVWGRRRPLYALLILSIAGFVGLGYWLVQITSPFGIASDPVLAGDWAQAGVNALAEPKGSGFVLETQPEVSLISELASLGLPFRVLVLVPQVAALVALGFLVLLPFCFLRSRTTAAFAAALAVGGGLWPGLAPYGSILARPSALLAAIALAGFLLAPSRSRRARRMVRRFRLGIAAAAVAAATLDRALEGGREPALTAALLLVAAAMVLASPLRATLRASSPSPSISRQCEALLLLVVFGGSGLLWWDPPRSLPGFNDACNPNGAFQGAPMDWIRRNVPKDKVILASPVYSAPVAAFAGRRVLFSPAATEAQARIALAEQPRREHLLDSARLGQPVAKMAEAFSVTHFFLGPGEADPPVEAATVQSDEPSMRLVLVYRDVKDFRVFRLEKK